MHCLFYNRTTLISINLTLQSVGCDGFHVGYILQELIVDEIFTMKIEETLRRQDFRSVTQIMRTAIGEFTIALWNQEGHSGM